MHISFTRFAASTLASLLWATRALADQMPCPLPTGIDPESVVPVVRSVGFAEAVRASLPGELPMRPIAGDVVTVYVENRVSTLNYFGIPEVDRECWSGRETQRATLHNLARVVTQFHSRASKARGVTLVTSGGNFEPSFLLAFGVLRKTLDVPLDRYVVGIPNTDMLLIADPQDAVALKGLQELVDESYSRPDRPLSRHLFLVTRCTVSTFDASAMESARCP